MRLTIISAGRVFCFVILAMVIAFGFFAILAQPVQSAPPIDGDGFHRACLSGFCRLVPGDGNNTCETHSNCGWTPTPPPSTPPVVTVDRAFIDSVGSNPNPADSSVTLSVSGWAGGTVDVCEIPDGCGGQTSNELYVTNFYNVASPASIVGGEFNGQSIPLSHTSSGQLGQCIDNGDDECTFTYSPGSFRTFTGSKNFNTSALPNGEKESEVRVLNNIGKGTIMPIPFSVLHPGKTLTVSKNNNSYGTLTSNPSGINCGGDCDQDYGTGTDVTITADPAAGYAFDSWQSISQCLAGPCPRNGNQITCDMTANRHCRANFVQIAACSDGSDNEPDGQTDEDDPGCSGPTDNDEWNQWRTMTAEKNISAAGTVTGPNGRQGNGINCGTDCTEDYNDGTTVSITASPAGGYQFDNWSNCSNSTNASISVTMNAAKTCRANFSAIPASTYLLTATNNGCSLVTAPTGTNDGISCGSNCSEAYDEDTVVPVSKTVPAGWQFDNWSGDCIGSGACNLTMDANKSVTANCSLVGGTGTVEVITNVDTTWNFTVEPVGGPANQATLSGSKTYSNQPTGAYTLAPADSDGRACPVGYLCPPSVSPPGLSQTLVDGLTITFDLTYDVDTGSPLSCSPIPGDEEVAIGHVARVTGSGGTGSADYIWDTTDGTQSGGGNGIAYVDVSYPSVGNRTVGLDDVSDTTSCNVNVVFSQCPNGTCEADESCSICEPDCGSCSVPGELFECNDGIDNNADGKVDCSSGGLGPDPGCYPDGNGGGGECDPDDDSEGSENVPEIDEF